MRCTETMSWWGVSRTTRRVRNANTSSLRIKRKCRSCTVRTQRIASLGWIEEEPDVLRHSTPTSDRCIPSDSAISISHIENRLVPSPPMQVWSLYPLLVLTQIFNHSTHKHAMALSGASHQNSGSNKSADNKQKESRINHQQTHPTQKRRRLKSPEIVRGSKAVRATLSKYDLVVIEGLGLQDPRDPSEVAEHIVNQMERRWQDSTDSSTPKSSQTIPKPKLVIIQGDPLREQGISAITPIVADRLGASRGLVCLDEEIADYHSPKADRENVVYEFVYSDLVTLLEEALPGSPARLEAVVDRRIDEKNLRRAKEGKPPLRDYFKVFALLQEVTKAVCRIVSDEGGSLLSVVHTQQRIGDYTVTSFCEAGFELGLVDQDRHMVAYPVDDLDVEDVDRNR